MKQVIQEFKDFAVRGNAIDLAVGIVIGSAFTKIVSSLVSDLITPLLGYLVGQVDFKFIKLGNVLLGNFLQAIIDFLIIAFAIFMFVKLINRFMKMSKKEAKDAIDNAPPKLSNTEVLLGEIRDSIKNIQNK